uniref:ADP-ribosylation factor-like protein 16 n=1 Tax=Tetraselmis sp. GSL018 TaxID=582737 RepID=A0A061S246_9CHLO|mmetsp:Transcript_2270/g.5353  ORF Transcript_2270/g.5353 Transcript_2270/m.5353 type:complete len:204 (+) Transcript_2270:134-745(+)
MCFLLVLNMVFEVSVLVLGVQGSGKTLLLKRIQGIEGTDQERFQRLCAETVSTAGVELVKKPLGKKGTLSFREIGGCMLSIWPRFYGECGLVAFVVDASDPSAIPDAAVCLHKVMRHEEIQGKPLAVVLNKMDCASALRRAELERLLMIPPGARQTPKVAEVSAWTGDGVLELLDWAQGHAMAQTEQAPAAACRSCFRWRGGR